MGKARAASFSCAVLLAAAVGVAAQQAPRGLPGEPVAQQRLGPGVVYRQFRARTPQGEPWSIHVLEVNRRERSVEIRAAAGQNRDGEMQRDLPSALGRGELARGSIVLGVVNGDYDLAAPYLGVPDGLSVTSTILWTTGKPDWPAMAILRAGEPVIAVPEVRVEMRAGPQRWAIGAVNKPLGSAHGGEPRLYSREFRGSVKSASPFRAAVLTRVSPPLPLRVNRAVRARVQEVFAETTEATIPRDGLVVVQRLSAEPAGRTAGPAPLTVLRPGQAVRIELEVRVGGSKNIREAIGGFPILLRDGKPNIVGTPSEYLARRHPRTATCYSRERVVFAVVDGRQPQLSVGMTLGELAELMASLGCQVAMNTDGGGSSVMAVAAPGEDAVTGVEAELPAPLRIVNSPSDGRERGRGNAWLIVARRKGS